MRKFAQFAKVDQVINLKFISFMSKSSLLLFLFQGQLIAIPDPVTGIDPDAPAPASGAIGSVVDGIRIVPTVQIKHAGPAVAEDFNSEWEVEGSEPAPHLAKVNSADFSGIEEPEEGATPAPFLGRGSSGGSSGGSSFGSGSSFDLKDGPATAPESSAQGAQEPTSAGPVGATAVAAQVAAAPEGSEGEDPLHTAIKATATTSQRPDVQANNVRLGHYAGQMKALTPEQQSVVNGFLGAHHAANTALIEEAQLSASAASQAEGAAAKRTAAATQRASAMQALKSLGEMEEKGLITLHPADKKTLEVLKSRDAQAKAPVEGPGSPVVRPESQPEARAGSPAGTRRPAPEVPVGIGASGFEGLKAADAVPEHLRRAAAARITRGEALEGDTELAQTPRPVKPSRSASPGSSRTGSRPR